MSMSWEMEYKKRLRTADEALECVKSGMRVYIQPGCAEPETLVEALMRRAAVNDGRADYTPIYLSEIESLFESGQMPIDVALIEVSPPDSHGFCSFGVGVDTTLTAARVAKHVVAQINDYMPRTYGDSFIHVDDIDAFVESSRPLCALKTAIVSDLQVAIAKKVTGLIEDGAVLQTGIGGIPDAVLPF